MRLRSRAGGVATRRAALTPFAPFYAGLPVVRWEQPLLWPLRSVRDVERASRRPQGSSQPMLTPTALPSCAGPLGLSPKKIGEVGASTGGGCGHVEPDGGCHAHGRRGASNAPSRSSDTFFWCIQDIAKETAKDWRGLRVTVKLTVQNRQAKVSVVPSAAALIIKALKEPVRDRKKVRGGRIRPRIMCHAAACRRRRARCRPAAQSDTRPHSRRFRLSAAHVGPILRPLQPSSPMWDAALATMPGRRPPSAGCSSVEAQLPPPRGEGGGGPGAHAQEPATVARGPLRRDRRRRTSSTAATSPWTTSSR